MNTRITLAETQVPALLRATEQMKEMQSLLQVPNTPIESSLTHSEIALLRALLTAVISEQEEIQTYLTYYKEMLWQKADINDKSVDSEIAFCDLNTTKNDLRKNKKQKAKVASILKKLKLQQKFACS